MTVKDKPPTDATIVISMDTPCAECGRGGATGNGLCLGCTSKAIGGRRMRSDAGRAVQSRFRAVKSEARSVLRATEEDRTVELGSNTANEDLKRRATALKEKLDQIADLQEEVKQLKAEAKADGYDLKALNQVVKELRRGPDYQAAQLELELVLDTYRRAVDLPTTLEAAQEAAREAATVVPSVDEGEADDERRPVRKDLN